MSELSRLRTLLGRSTTLWAGGDGVSIEQDRWLALSGAPSVEYNVALCHGADAAEDLRRTLQDLIAARAPAIIMVAGEALANVQTLVQAGWICIGATPFMALQLRQGEPHDGVRRLSPDELSRARGLLQEAFDLSPELTVVALPDASVRAEEGRSVWGLFEDGELVSCAAFVTVEEAVIGWSVATPPRFARRGYAVRMLSSVLAHSEREGAAISLVYASAAGEGLYRKLGFKELERWQMWSRPRWVLARA